MSTDVSTNISINNRPPDPGVQDVFDYTPEGNAKARRNPEDARIRTIVMRRWFSLMTTAPCAILALGIATVCAPIGWWGIAVVIGVVAGAAIGYGVGALIDRYNSRV